MGKQRDLLASNGRYATRWRAFEQGVAIGGRVNKFYLIFLEYTYLLNQ